MRDIFQILLDAIVNVLSEAYWRVRVGGLLGLLCGFGAAGWLGRDAGSSWLVAGGLGLGLLFGIIWHARQG